MARTAITPQAATAAGTAIVFEAANVDGNSFTTARGRALHVRNGAAVVNEVQTINLGSATAGTITITFAGQTTAAIAFNATASAVQTALEALSNIAPGDVTVTGGPLPGAITLTFGGAYAGVNVAQVTVTPTGLTGGTVTVATTTEGVPNSINVTLPTPATADGLAVADRAVTVAAGAHAVIGLGASSQAGIYAQLDGSVYVDYSAVTTVTVAVIDQP